MLLFDDAGVYREVNDAACVTFGRAREQLIGRPVGELTRTERRAAIPDLLARLRRDGHPFALWCARRPDGSELEVQVTATANVPVPGRHLAIYVPADGRETERPAGDGYLWAREREVTRLLALGLSGEKIARELVLSPDTVRTHFDPRIVEAFLAVVAAEPVPAPAPLRLAGPFAPETAAA